MKEDIIKVITCLQTLDIKPTYANMNTLLGSIQILQKVLNNLPEEGEQNATDAE